MNYVHLIQLNKSQLEGKVYFIFNGCVIVLFLSKKNIFFSKFNFLIQFFSFITFFYYFCLQFNVMAAQTFAWILEMALFLCWPQNRFACLVQTTPSRSKQRRPPRHRHGPVGRVVGRRRARRQVQRHDVQERRRLLARARAQYAGAHKLRHRESPLRRARAGKMWIHNAFWNSRRVINKLNLKKKFKSE